MNKELFIAYQDRLRDLSDSLTEILEEIHSRKQELESSLMIAIKLEHKIEEDFIRKEFEPLVEMETRLQQLYYNITKPYDE